MLAELLSVGGARNVSLCVLDVSFELSAVLALSEAVGASAGSS